MDEPGVPLSHYLECHPRSGVRFTCNACQTSEDIPVRLVVNGLKARGLGDESTGIRAVAVTLKSPCKRCGATRWETRPGFPME